MTPRTAQVNDAIKEESRANILASARHLFTQQGYEATPIKDIAHHAGISQGLLYHYFPSKEALLKAVLHDYVDRLGAQLLAGIATLPDPLEQAKFLLRHSLAYSIADKASAYLFYSLRVQPNLQAIVGPDFSQWGSIFRGNLETFLTQAGQSNPKEKALWLAISLDGIFLQGLLESEEFPAHLMLEQAIQRYID